MGAGTRVLLDYELSRLRIRPARIDGYRREEFTHMAVAVAVASELADCGLGVRSAALALDLDFVPIEKEEYDLVLRRDFACGALGETLLQVVRSAEFQDAVRALGGYETGKTGSVKDLETKTARRRERRRAV
jgi:putative molybdopterin biosynthesis protein